MSVGVEHPASTADADGCLAASAGLVTERIRALLGTLADDWVPHQPQLAELFLTLGEFVEAGGKRLRPMFCMWGAAGAGADPATADVLDAAAGLELLHAFALIHDDVMDGSDVRRGRPSVHRRFADGHAAGGLAGESRRFGEGLAVLVGDLAFVLADVLVGRLDRQVRVVWDELRIELTMGQWIDLVGAASGLRSAQTARWLAAYKSGRYTVERPLQLGATIAGRPELVPSFAAVGGPLGAAFQLRDDLLGIVGDSACTGKPVGADLREGKTTLPLALASERADGAGRRLLARAGCDDLTDGEVEAIRDLVVECGAADAVEREIGRLVDDAVAALDACDIEPAAVAPLRRLCDLAAWRDR